MSVLFSGGLALLKVGGIWFAIKDAVLPTLIGIFILVSLRSKSSLMRELFYNDQVLDVARVDAALLARGQGDGFDRLLRRMGVWLALGFIGSAPLGFALARYVLKSPPGTPAFNAELGRLHLLVWPVIVVPSLVVTMFVLWKLLTGLRDLTGLTTDELFHAEPEKKPAEAKSS
jgi:hypothetical protein